MSIRNRASGDTGTDLWALNSEDFTSGILGRFLLGIAFLLAFVSLGVHQTILQDDPEAFDIPAYLLEANRIDQYGGVTAFPRMILDGKFEQSNQHPLYILAIAPFAEFDFDFMVSAQLVSLFFGAIAVLLGYLVIQRLYSHLIASLATAGFLLTHLFIQWSTLVACESLLILFSILGIASIIAGFRNSRYWAVAGLFVGLAYLTKVTALLLLPGFVVAAVLTYRLEIFKTKNFYLFFVTFIVGCSPLLLNNAVVYGNPIYNKNIDNLSDSKVEVAYNEISMERGSMIRVYQSVEADAAEKGKIAIGPNAVVDLASGVLRRLPREFTMFLETLSIWPMHTAPTSLRWIFGASILGLFLVGVRREKQIGAQIYIVVTVLTFLVALSLHRPLPRYLLPITYFIWVFAAIGLCYLLERFCFKDGRKIGHIYSGMKVGVGILALAASSYIVATKPISEVWDSVYLSDANKELVAWMRDNIGPGDRYVEGPNYRWVLRNGVYLFPTEEVRSNREKFERFLQTYNVRYVIAEWKSMNFNRYRGGGVDRRLKFEGILDFDENQGIVEVAVPDGWDKVAFDQEGRVEFIVYEINSTKSETMAGIAAVHN